MFLAGVGVEHGLFEGSAWCAGAMEEAGGEASAATAAVPPSPSTAAGAVAPALAPSLAAALQRVSAHALSQVDPLLAGQSGRLWHKSISQSVPASCQMPVQTLEALGVMKCCLLLHRVDRRCRRRGKGNCEVMPS